MIVVMITLIILVVNSDNISSLGDLPGAYFYMNFIIQNLLYNDIDDDNTNVKQRC